MTSVIFRGDDNCSSLKGFKVFEVKPIQLIMSFKRASCLFGSYNILLISQYLLLTDISYTKYLLTLNIIFTTAHRCDDHIHNSIKVFRVNREDQGVEAGFRGRTGIELEYNKLLPWNGIV